MNQKISLLELNKQIQEKINVNFPESIWVIAEISEIKINRNGHCYLELIEKDLINENIIARNRATIWAFTFRILKPYFESTTGQELTQGIKILFRAKIEFHEVFGLSLNITDIDPNYTLGELAQKKAETIMRLENEGVINMNKELELPLVIQKIAIISSDTAAGYQDFINQLINNKNQFKYYTKLFPSIMQGVQAEESIIKSLELIYKYEDFFDIVVLIRGGGSQADLNCFNSYLLATNIAQFPIPILTGIGHDKDESVSDIVAHTKLKTPTAVAEYINAYNQNFEDHIDYLKTEIYQSLLNILSEQNKIIDYKKGLIVPLIRNILYKEKNKILNTTHNIKHITSKHFHKSNTEIRLIFSNLKTELQKIIIHKNQHINQFVIKTRQETKTFLQSSKYKVLNFENSSHFLDPLTILKRGFSITYLNDQVIRNNNDVNNNDRIITRLYNSEIESIVKK
ncbi:MAG: exodeoxyribonuclease VII large subunit [Bacteroidetes bacterium GWA2_31_9b]|nr:MAG: exodeoxyribonuclease VII large subunit [Bacteroidetes bacterium GWA2_31_9b]